MVEDGDGDRLVTELAAEIAPAAAGAPGSIASFSFAGEVDAVNAGVVELGDRGGAAGGVGKDFGLVRGSFQGASDAHAEDAFFVVGEDHFFAEGLQCGDAVDAAEIGGAAEDETGMLLQDWPLLAGDPVGFNLQLALLRAAFCQREWRDDGCCPFWGRPRA